MGDERAWEEAYGRALAVARRRGLGAEAEDVASGVVEKLLDLVARNRVRDPVAFPAYIAAMAANAAMDEHRAPGRRRRAGGEDVDRQMTALPDPAPDALREAAGRERWEAFQRALGRLPEECRNVLAAYFEHIHLRPGGSYKTLARALRSSRGTISSRVNRCLDELLRDSDFGKGAA